LDRVEREGEIDRVVRNTVGLCGDLQGKIGGQIPEIAVLQLDDRITARVAEIIGSLQPVEDG